MQAFAKFGCVAVFCDGFGTNRRGRKFLDHCWQNVADSGLIDHKAFIRAAALNRPWMNLERVGIYGGSAGGQSAVRALLDHGDLYKVGVADCGCHDNRVDKVWWNEQWFGSPVVGNPCYEDSSNVAHASRLGEDQRLMLMVGEMDRNVDPVSTMQLAGALQRAGKDFELVVMVGEGHGCAETAYGSRKRLGFLLRHLGCTIGLAAAF
jgi:dipeptidyl-peptidase 4